MPKGSRVVSKHVRFLWQPTLPKKPPYLAMTARAEEANPLGYDGPLPKKPPCLAMKANLW